MSKKIDQSHVEELKQLMDNVPFGNSEFQIKQFVSSQETPERKYRNALLQAKSKIQALEETKYKRDLLEVDLRELEEKLSVETNPHEKRRHEINLKYKRQQLDDQMKLIADAIFELSAYKQIIDSLPKFSREQFEQAELNYWQQRLLNDAKREYLAGNRVEKGTLESLNKVGINVGYDEKRQLIWKIDEKFLLENK